MRLPEERGRDAKVTYGPDPYVGCFVPGEDPVSPHWGLDEVVGDGSRTALGSSVIKKKHGTSSTRPGPPHQKRIMLLVRSLGLS